MESYLRDVHHYLFDATFSPRPGETYQVRTEIRRRTIEAIVRGSQRPGPHLVVGHSLGSVVAYDCLKLMPGCPPVDALLTIGSPLGLDEVQDQLKPGWSRGHGFPADRVRGRWVNVFDPLDPVAGFDPYLANDFQSLEQPRVEDFPESNSGWWRHNIAKYLKGPRLRAAVRELIAGA